MSGFGSNEESQVAMANRALRIAAERNNVPAPPAPQSVTATSPCATAVSGKIRVGGNEEEV